jgi:hypothetical protein
MFVNYIFEKRKDYCVLNTGKSMPDPEDHFEVQSACLGLIVPCHHVAILAFKNYQRLPEFSAYSPAICMLLTPPNTEQNIRREKCG